MKQKLTIACAAAPAKVIIFDEPLTGLDPGGIRRMKDVIRRLARDGAAIILSSHLLSLLEEVCTTCSSSRTAGKWPTARWPRCARASRRARTSARGCLLPRHRRRGDGRPRAHHAVTSAFLYLQFTTVKNTLVQRFRRLKQPKYLVGAIAGLAYFYLMFFRRVMGGGSSGRGLPGALTMPPTWCRTRRLRAAALFLIVVLAGYSLGARRAAVHRARGGVSFSRARHAAPADPLQAVALAVQDPDSTFFLSLVFRRAVFSAAAR